MNNNELVYEMVLDTAWSSDRLDANSWLSAFIDRRYALHQIRSNMAKEHAQEAWRLLAVSFVAQRRGEWLILAKGIRL